jgi:DNA modification methylase
MIIEKKKLSELKPAPYNPRQSTAKQEKHLKASLEKFGVVEPIIYNKQTGYIVGGHFRVRELTKLGYKEVECVIVDLNEEDERELNIRLNANTGEWDWDSLANEWDVEKLDDWGLDLPIDLSVKELEAEEDEFDVPEGGIETDIVLGDLFEIGEHRLLCGDSTDSDSVAKLMNGEKANLSFTSPPYNAGKSEMLSGNTHTTDNKYNEYSDNQKQTDYLDLLVGFTNNALLFSDYLICNIQSLAGNKIALIEYLNEYKNNFIDVAIWDKGHGAPAMAENVLTSAWEYMFFISSKENASRAIPNANFRGTVPNIYRGAPNRNNEFSNVHAATFPIDLPEWALQFTKEKDIVLDQFLGTGTTMVASHQLKRKCYGMELDPKYCQVIIDRMKKLDPSLVIKKNGVELK